MTRPRLVLLHGSVRGADATWGAQAPLAERFELELVTRRGYPPGPPPDGRIDFEDAADELAASLRAGDHLVGLSYGGVYALAVAARRPDLGSLTVVEPPAFGLALEHPAAREIVERVGPLRREMPEPLEYLRRFMASLGEDPSRVPDPLPPELEQGVRAAAAESPPWEVDLRLDAVAAAPYPRLAVSGGWHDAFEAVCDAIAGRTGADRAVLPGARHYVPSLGAPFNDLLAAFVQRALR